MRRSRKTYYSSLFLRLKAQEFDSMINFITELFTTTLTSCTQLFKNVSRDTCYSVALYCSIGWCLGSTLRLVARHIAQYRAATKMNLLPELDVVAEPLDFADDDGDDENTLIED